MRKDERSLSDVALLGPNAEMFAAQHAAYQVEEFGFGHRLLYWFQSVGGIHANRVFSAAFSVPSNHNELIGLKDDRGRRRIEVLDPVFRRSPLS